jgi:ADP-ribosyl-[dinitrogen reductase] hydrolase
MDMNNNSLIIEAPSVVGLLSNTPRSAPVDEDRARGTVLGLAAGNLLGLPVEGRSASSISRALPTGVWEVDPLERSRPMDDDLAQAVDLAEALLEGGDYVANIAQRLVRWRRENGRGIGLTTSAVLDLLEEGHRPPDAARTIYEERGHVAPNGGLMRCAPVALARHSESAMLIRDSAATCAVTHYAPACQWSCVIINASIAMLLKGVEPPVSDLVSAAVADGAPAEVGEWAARVGADVGDLALDQGHISHTLLCMQAGLWALTTPMDLEAALVRIVSAGGDTDTNGAVAGAALGARYGASAIPQRWLDCIPQRERLESLALRLVNAAP